MIYLDDDSQWYKDAVIYELTIKSFYDSNGDGIGDFRGLLEKLDYLEDLGITTLWLLPFYPSPLRDDGYDIADYLNINSDYGTLSDFREFLRGAHSRGIRVITELVLNHTSNEHPWFQRSRMSKPGSKWRNYYVWSDTPDKYADARIIFKDFESSNWTWDPIAKAYYWHRFYSHQPDLNYEHLDVQRRILEVIDFWMREGVDGLRLDAVPYLYECEGTSCENLPQTHQFLKKIRHYIDSKYKNRMLLAEANQWPEDAVAYFGNNDECHMAFHFPIMPRIFMAIRMEDRFPLVDIMEQTPDIPDEAQWAIFLRNHDELTLEMVTDEERDYMYRVYARDPRARINLGIRRRLAPLLNNDRRKIELANLLLFSLPGTPVIYYGDEIGMGDNYYLGDRNGVRTPMQWSPDRNAGFSMANPQSLYLPVIIDPEYHYESVNVETQKQNLSSLYWWMKKMISTRKRFKTMGRGNLKFVFVDNPKVLSFTRQYKDEIILVVINLSRLSQSAEIDLSQFAGQIPREVFSQNQFPVIKEHPYHFTLGPYDYFWFLLEQTEAIKLTNDSKISSVPVLDNDWRSIFKGKWLESLEKTILPEFLSFRPWFGNHQRKIQELKIIENIRLTNAPRSPHLLIIHILLLDGDTEYYSLLINYAPNYEAKQILELFSDSEITRIRITNGEEGILYDAVYDKECRDLLLSLMMNQKHIKGKNGQFISHLHSKLPSEMKDRNWYSTVFKQCHYNAQLIYENQLFLKFYHNVETEINSEIEIISELSKDKRINFIPRLKGSFQYRDIDSHSVLLGILEEFSIYQNDGWSFSLDIANRFFDRLQLTNIQELSLPKEPFSFFDLNWDNLPQEIITLIEPIYFEFIDILGQRTAELHLALAKLKKPSFQPETFSQLYQRSIYQRMQSTVRKALQILTRRFNELSKQQQKDFEQIKNHQADIFNRLKKVLNQRINGMKIRIHNEYHLGKILYTGKDLVIIDFDGSSYNALSERRLKRSPLRNLVDMMRSFHHLIYHSLLNHPSISISTREDYYPWADVWYVTVSGIFITAYLQKLGKTTLLPEDRNIFSDLLEAFLLEKLFSELIFYIDTNLELLIVPFRALNLMLDISKK